MADTYASRGASGKVLRVTSPPIQLKLDLPRMGDRKPLPPEIERKLFGPVEFASGLSESAGDSPGADPRGSHQGHGQGPQKAA